jgi:hypothetical protein
MEKNLPIGDHLKQQRLGQREDLEDIMMRTMVLDGCRPQIELLPFRIQSEQNSRPLRLVLAARQGILGKSRRGGLNSVNQQMKQRMRKRHIDILDQQDQLLGFGRYIIPRQRR